MSEVRTPVDDVRWLDADEQHAWRRLAALMLRLPAEIEHQLQRDAEMSHFDYWVIALLSEAPGHRLRLKELADYANSSLSRLSHVITRLEGRGWVVRERCPDDARATFAVLTEAGLAKVVETAPGHVTHVRSIVFDALGPGDVHDLSRICEAILGRIDAPGT